MGERKQGVIVIGHQSPIKQLVSKYNDFELVIKKWLANQSITVEVTIVTIASSLQGAAFGGVTGTFGSDVTLDFSIPFTPVPPPQAKTSFLKAKVSGGPMVQARNFAVIAGVNAGLSCVMRRLRGKEDVKASMVAAFGSGVMFSLVNGMGSPNHAANAISSGVLFALVQGGIFKVWEKFSQPQTEDVLYNETRSLSTNNSLPSVCNRDREGGEEAKKEGRRT